MADMTPYAVVNMHDGSWNVVYGPGRREFVCVCGFGDEARANAQKIAKALNAAEPEDRNA